MKELKQTTLSQSPELKPKVLKLLQDSFSYEEGFSFEVDFAPLMAEENASNCHILTQSDEVIAHIGVLQRFIKTKKGKTPIALIGAVCVSEKYRKQGYFQELMTKVLSQYQSQVAFFVLWSDLVETYKPYGFFLAGGQIENLPISSLNLRDHGFFYSKFSLLNKDQQERIAEIHKDYFERHYTSISRSKKDWEKILKIESANLIIYRPQMEIEGYLVMNKGMDLQGIIHEYACTKSVEKKFEQILSSTRCWMAENKPLSEVKGEVQYMALFKVGHQDLFKTFIEEWSQSKIRVITIEDQSICFSFEKDIFTEEFEEFMQLIFGPGKALEFHEINKPLFISGLDSI